MQRNYQAELDSQFLLEFFNAILKTGGIRGVRCEIVTVMKPVEEGKSDKVDPLDREWKQYAEFVGSVPTNQEKALRSTLTAFKFDYDFKPEINNRLGFSVQQNQVQERFNQGRTESGLLYFIYFYLQQMKKTQDKFNQALRAPERLKTIWFYFHPTVSEITYHGRHEFDIDNGLPAVSYSYIKEESGSKKSGLFLESQAPKHPARRSEKPEIEFMKQYKRIPNLFFLASIMHCQFMPRLRKKGASPTAFQTKVTDTLHFFPRGLQALVLDYISREMNSELVQFLALKSPKEYKVPNQYQRVEAVFLELTGADIQHLMSFTENYQDFYWPVEDHYTTHVENIKNLHELFSKLCMIVSDEKLFSEDNSLDASRKKLNENFQSAVYRLGADIEWIAKWGGSTNGVDERVNHVVCSINDFWAVVSKNKDNLYYYQLANFFCCELYEKEFKEPFPARITEEDFIWIAAQHGFVAKPKESPGDKKDDAPRPGPG